MVAPYRDSTPRPDAAPRVRRRWALRGDDLDRAMSGVLWAASAVVWCMAFIPFGLCPFVARWAVVEVVTLALWALVFVTREPIA